ncbi:MAG: pyrroline-5-carboxylate reductase [Bryobacteraceae bacterium]
MLSDQRIAVLGAGNMGGALIRGLLRTGAVQPDQIRATTRTPQSAESVAKHFGIKATAGGNLEVCEWSTVILVGVKPLMVSTVLDQIRWALSENRPLISLAAAFPMSLVEQSAGRRVPVFRAVPNTPVAVGEGATAIAHNGLVKPEQIALVEAIFRSVGRVCFVAEDHLDAATALSGSGPAFVFTVIEAMMAGGLKAGLPRDAARRLAEQTVLGAAKMVRDSGHHPAVLRDQVITPGGTTIAGLYELERLGLRAALMSAVEAAALQSRDMTGHIVEQARLQNDGQG